MQTLTKAALLFTTGLFALFLLISPTYSAEDDVSRPAGFVRIEVGSNSSVLAAMPFEPFEGVLGAVFSNQLVGAATEEAADRVMQWDNQCQCYKISFKADNTGDSAKDGRWFESGTNWVVSTQTLNQGSGFWVENRHEAQAIILGGAVVLDGTQTVEFLQGLNVFGYPYATRKALSSAELAESGAYGSTNEESADQVITGAGVTNWLIDPAENWVTGTGSVSETVFGLGDGYWYRRQPSEALEWLIDRPYEDLFEGGSNAPAIIGFTVDDGITLSIACSGAAGETLEIFYKDLTAEDCFISGSGWAIAEEGIATTGRSVVTWVDTDDITGVFCRVYLVGRSDLDSDSDGLSDASERFVFQTSEEDNDTDNDGLLDGAEVSTYQTDPLDADTDEDGMSDGSEVFWGYDPTNADDFAVLPWADDFEARTPGDIGGQNGWIATPAGTILVQSNTVQEGGQALQLSDSLAISSLHHSFGACGSSNVWVDFQVKLVPGALPDIAACTNRATAIFAVNTAGELCGYDGFSNDWKKVGGIFQSLETWNRVTIKLDYGMREWSLNVDGLLVFGHLGFKDDTVSEFSRAQWSGSTLGDSYLDDINITTTEPEDLDDDGDGLPNVWEREYGAANPGDDLDGDGLTNLEEYQLQTNPTKPDGDGDGLADGVEHDWGTDPAQSNAYTSIPWGAGFETNEGYDVGSVSGVNGWTVREGQADVQDTDVHTGDQALKLQDGSVEHYSVSETGLVVWTSLNIQMIPGPLPGMSGNLAHLTAAVALSGDQRLAGYDGTSGQWMVATNTSDVELYQWVELAIRKDYGNGTWSLYRDGRPVLKGLGFADSSMKRMARVAVEGVGVIDDLAIGTEEPDNLDSDYDGLTDLQEDANTNGVVDSGETNPEDADSDKDGMDDGAEVAWGFCATAWNQFSVLPWSATFEAEQGYTSGILNGQPVEFGWESTDSVEVQCQTAYEGTNAVEIKAQLEEASSAKYYLAADTEPNVWVDWHARLLPGVLPDGEALSSGNAVMLAVDLNGRVCAYNSREKVWQITDVEYQTAADEWARITINADYANKLCSVYVDGVRVFRDLPFVDESRRWLSRFAISVPPGTGQARSTYLDSVVVTATEVPGLDNDGDGMANAWEITYGLNPEHPSDAHQDLDNDGVDNVDEYVAGSDPTLADSDSDGVSDRDEIEFMHSNPLYPEFTEIVDVFVANGADATNTLGMWETEGSTIFAQGRRGFVEYDVYVPSNDMYRLQLEGNEHYWGYHEPFEVHVSIDGEFISKNVLFASDETNGTITCVTPFIRTGVHRVRIFWENAQDFTSFQVFTLRVQALIGPDSNENGIKDWVENALLNTCSVETSRLESVTSPACLEGAGGYLSMMSLSEGIEPCHGAGKRWYANVLLSPTNDVNVTIHFQNDGYVITNTVTWKPTNLLDSNAQTVRIRIDDSILLAVWPEGATDGTFSVDIVGVTNYQGSVSSPIPHLFASTGNYSLVGLYVPGLGNPQGVTTSVQVLDASLPGSPLCWMGKTREWNCPGLSRDVTLETDSPVSLEVGLASESGRSFLLKTSDNLSHFVVARLPANGSIITNLPVRSVRVFDEGEDSAAMRLIETHSDMSQSIEIAVVVSPLEPDFRLQFDIFVGGIVFEAGGVTRTLEYADFNELGECPLRFIRAPYCYNATCHTLHAYQNDEPIGESD